MSEVNIYKPNVWQFETEEKMIESVSTKIFDEIHSAVSHEGLARVAFSGGEDNLKIIEKISKDSLIPWEEVEVFQVDEKICEGEGTNQNRLKEATCEDFVNEVKELNLFNTKKTVSESLDEYNERLDALDGTLFDVVVVEINKDGSFGGLFCSCDGLKHQKGKYTTSVKDVLSPNEIVLTMNIETILSSRAILAIVSGEDKEDVMDDLFDPSIAAVDFPAKFLLANPNLHFYVWIN